MAVARPRRPAKIMLIRMVNPPVLVYRVQMMHGSFQPFFSQQPGVGLGFGFLASACWTMLGTKKMDSATIQYPYLAFMLIFRVFESIN
jgi:hypothetical protein